MNCADGNNVGSVFCVEIVKIRNVLEIVCENVAAVNNLVGLNVIGEFNNLKGYVFLCKDVFRYFKDFCMRSGRSRNGNAFAFKSIVIYGGVKAVAGVFNNAYNGALILLGNEIRDLLASRAARSAFASSEFSFPSFTQRTLLYAEEEPSIARDFSMGSMPASMA